jgi:hypothetical protein
VLERKGFSWEAGCRAIIFALESDRDAIETFRPTVYVFDRAGFERAPTGEFVSRGSREAGSAGAASFAHARRRWRFDVLCARDPHDLVHRLGSVGVGHQTRTSRGRRRSRPMSCSSCAPHPASTYVRP